ncbi:MAG: MBL fold metallo-hydrolase [Oscillospiraceae bacterium]|nr:MBL fold metallo-hydrolase [Oscillospiraceae bacterium]
MLIKNLVVGHLATNCYIVTDEQTMKCVIIDPGAESNMILEYIEANKMTVEAILITHGHFDHIFGAPNLQEELNVPLYINERDAYSDGPRDHYRLEVQSCKDVRYYGEGDTITVGSLTFTVIETPGHSRGSVTLKIENVLFTGDTLFRDSVGRTDLDGGDMRVLLRSLIKLYDIEGEYEVYPGHMEATTLERERRFNYYMNYANREFRGE